MATKKEEKVDTEAPEFGVFIYENKNNEILGMLNFGDRDLAKSCFEGTLLMENQYCEMWEKDKDGYYGNSGVPLYSKGKGAMKPTDPKQ